MQNKSGFQFLRNPKGRLVFWSGELGMASAPSGGRWWRQERPSPVHSHPTSESLSHQSREVSWLGASRIKEVAWSCTLTWSLSFPAHTKSGDVVIGCVSSKCKISLSTILVALGGKQISMGVSYIPTLTCLKLITKDQRQTSWLSKDKSTLTITNTNRSHPTSLTLHTTPGHLGSFLPWPVTTIRRLIWSFWNPRIEDPES